jgi:lipoprotein-releasing system permease protein
LSFPFYIARRYTISRSKSTAVNIITRIAALGIVVSTTALFVILSVFSGLKDFSINFTNVTDPDLKITPKTGKSFFITPEQEQQLAKATGIASYSKVVEERVLFYFDQKEQVAYLKGVDSLFTKVNPMEEQLVGGQWFREGTAQAVVGAGTTLKLSMGIYDFNNALEVFVPKPGKGAIDTPEEAFNKTSLVPMGVYQINDEVDSKYVYADIVLAQELLQFKPNQISAIEFKLQSPASEAQAVDAINTIFKNKVTIKNRAQLNDSLYKMLNAENLITYLFCSLVVVLTLFCLAGALIMLILDKKENIKTLYSLGTEVSSLRKIFLYQGLFVTILGVIIGLAIGTGIILAQQHYSLLMITPTLPYPVNYNFTNILVVVLTIFILGFLASYIAAARVDKKLLKNI